MNKYIYPSERNFGITFAIFFMLISIFLYVYGSDFIPFFVSSIAIFVISFSFPIVLRPFNILWIRFGYLLSKITTPLFLLLIYFTLFIPIGIVMKIFRLDPLRQRKNIYKSFWITRDKKPETTDKQY